MLISRGLPLRVCAVFCVSVLHAAPAQTSINLRNLKLPLAFERQGTGSGERYIARGQGYKIAIEGGKTTIGVLAGNAVSMEFIGGRHLQAVAGPQLPGHVNYIHGNDPSKWKLGLPTFERVTYNDVYPGIDVVYYGNQQQLEFDMVLKPGADPRSIRMKFEGAEETSVDASGALVLKTSSGDVRLALPEIYQQTDGSKKSVKGRYVVGHGNEVGFAVADYDLSKPLVIDPTILFGALFGGGDGETQSHGVAVDAGGNIYIAGSTGDSDLPTTPGGAQPGFDGGVDGFVMKVNSSGSAFTYVTYLGGSAFDFLYGIAVDSTGAAWVGGQTDSPDFPMLNPYQGTLSAGANSNVLAKLSPTETLVFSTYLGGVTSGNSNGVAVDGSNNVYFVGSTTGPFPTTQGVVFSSSSVNFSVSSVKGFAAKFTSGGSIVYSTLLGGNSDDFATAVAADATGNVYVTGQTGSSFFTGAPSGGARPVNAGSFDAFITKLNPTGTALLYFTFLGGSSFDFGYSIAIDAGLNAYVGGYTSSTDLGTTTGVVQGNSGGGQDGFVAKLNATGSSFFYITYLGGNRDDYITSIAVEPSSGDVYLTGNTGGNFPLVSPFQTAPPGTGTLFETSNSGASWTALDANLPLVQSISPDPVSSGTLVASTETGIYRTTDGGASWAQMAAIQSANMARSPAESNTMYAMNNQNSYVSTDGGITWLTQSAAPSFYPDIIPDATSAATAYTYTPSGIFKTTDSGATWSLAPNAGLPLAVSPEASGMVAAPDGILYVAASGFGVYQSTDQAASWTALNDGLPPSTIGLSSLSVSAGSAGSPNVLYVVILGQIYKNSGTGWSAINGLPSGSVTLVASAPNNASTVYVAYAGLLVNSTFVLSPFLYLSLDGGSTWSPAGTGINNQLKSIVFSQQNSSVAFAVGAPSLSAFVAKLNPTAASLVYSTYLTTDSLFSFGAAIATLGPGEAVVTGQSGSSFPFQSSLPDPPPNGGSFVVAISDATATCTYSVNPASQSILGGFQIVTFGVNAPSGCGWTASSDQPWASILTGASGTGAGFVTVQAAANTTAETRVASISVNSAAAILTQASSSCSYSLSSSSWLTGNGGPRQVNVIAPAGCAWFVVNNDPSVISITAGSSGSGNGIVIFTVLPFSGLGARSLSLVVAGMVYAITESDASPAALIAPPAGTQLSTTSASFLWTTTVGADQYWLDVGSQVGMGDYFGQATTSDSLLVSSLPCDGRPLYIQVWTHISGGWQSPNRYTLTAASGCAALISPVDNSTFAGSSVTFNWNAASGADEYWLDVGNSLAHGDIFGGATALLSTTVNNIPCDGRAIYVQLWTHINGAWNNPGRYEDTAFTGSCSGTSGITSPTAGSVLTSPSQSFTWNPVSGADQYWLDVGTQVGVGDYYGAATTQTSVTVSSMPCDGRTLYVQWWVHINGNWQAPVRTTYTAASGCAALTSPVDGTVFTGFSQTFSWAAISGADQYWLDVGNAQAVGDIFGGATTSLSVEVNNLPCDGRIVYVQLWTHINGAWKNPGRYRDTATNVCGALTTPAPGSTLSGSAVTFNWTAGAGVTAYWLDVGTVVGQGNIFGTNVGTSLSQMVPGIPTMGQPIYVQLWSMISGVWHLNRYTYTAF